MRRPSFSLPRILLLSLLGALPATLGTCRYGSEDRPVIYRNVTSVGIGRETGECFGIAIKDDVVYVSDGATGVIKKLSSEIVPATFATGLQTPSAIAFLPTGEMMVADTGSHTVRKISEDGTVTLLAGIDGVKGSSDGPASTATFNAPVGIAADGDGTVYVSDTYNDRIRMIREGVVTTVAGSRRGFADGVGLSASFDTPLGLAMFGDKVLVADSGNARIRVVENNGVVSTLMGGTERDLINGTLAAARLVNPTAVAVDKLGAIFVADGNAIRVIGRRALPLVETLAGGRRGFVDGDSSSALFSRPSGIAPGEDRELYIADGDNRAVRVISDGPTRLTENRKSLVAVDEAPVPLATRWPFEPPLNPREIAGTLGEIRGEVGPSNKPVWFHNGLDIAGAYGEMTKFIRDETVLDPQSAENFGTSRELLRLPLIGYIHLRLGRDKDDLPFGDTRFQFERDPDGRLNGLRVPRGARFNAGDAIGTLNTMNHVHLIAGRGGNEINALAALNLPGVGDAIPPVIESVRLFGADWNELKPEGKPAQIRLTDRTRIVVRAHDRMDGNSDRRKLGVYRVGYQLFSNGSPLSNPIWPIEFDRMPSNDAVRFVYANGSQSGYKPNTIFDYIVTNHVKEDSFGEGFLETATLGSGAYTLRVFAGDYFGNVSSKDIDIMK